MNTEKKSQFKLEKSAVLTFIGIVLLFSSAVIVTLIAPQYVDPTWIQPTTSYQVQVYEIADPHLYISSAGGENRQYVYHLQKDFTLLAFQENELTRILAPKDLESYVTKFGDGQLKLTSKLLLLREPTESFTQETEALRQQLQSEWTKNDQNKDKTKPRFTILELYDPGVQEAFSPAPTDTMLENWVDQNYILIDEPKHSYHQDQGVIYILNPLEYRIRVVHGTTGDFWIFDPTGTKVESLEQLQSHPLQFKSRQELIRAGEGIYAMEGCFYCHTDQTRTLVQDLVLNGSDSYPAPPSSPNEYIYQRITFPGTRRIGPDLSRVGVKRPSRDWHKGHFWSPSSESKGSIMPSFKHFFDDDPRGVSKESVGIPNYKFEAIFQYLMTKGTRITPPNQAWWIGKDPIKTIEIIEGQRKIK